MTRRGQDPLVEEEFTVKSEDVRNLNAILLTSGSKALFKGPKGGQSATAVTGAVKDEVYCIC